MRSSDHFLWFWRIFGNFWVILAKIPGGVITHLAHPATQLHHVFTLLSASYYTIFNDKYTHFWQKLYILDYIVLSSLISTNLNSTITNTIHHIFHLPFFTLIWLISPQPLILNFILPFPYHSTSTHLFSFVYPPYDSPIPVSQPQFHIPLPHATKFISPQTAHPPLHSPLPFSSNIYTPAIVVFLDCGHHKVGGRMFLKCETYTG